MARAPDHVVREPRLLSTHFRFSLRALFALLTFCALAGAFVTALGTEIALGFSGFLFSFAFVWLAILALTPINWAIARLPYWSAFVLTPLLYCILSCVFYVFGAAIDKPHPTYLDGNWFTIAVTASPQLVPIVTPIMFILVALDCVVQRSRPRDSAYYPRLSTLVGSLSSLGPRLVLIFGSSLVLAYYTLTVLELYSSRQHSRSAMYWPPDRVFVTCHLFWGLHWFTDCLTRPRLGTIVAAIGFLTFASLFLVPIGFGVLRE